MSSSTWPSSHCISRLLQSCFSFCCPQLCLCWCIWMWVDVTCIGRNRILVPPGGQCCLLQFELHDVTEQGGLLGQTGQNLVFCGLHCCTHHCQNPLHKMSNTVLVRSQKISRRFSVLYPWVSLTSLSSCSSSGTSTSPRMTLDPFRSTFSCSSFWSNIEASSAWWCRCSHSCRSVPCSAITMDWVH